MPYELEIYDIQRNKHVLEIAEAPVVDSYGNVLAVEGIAHDITSKKKTQEIIKNQLEEIKVNNEEIKSTNEERRILGDVMNAGELFYKELNYIVAEMQDKEKVNE